MTITRAVIAHGFGATPQDHWFAWLAAALEARGITAVVPTLPDPQGPSRDTWIEVLEREIGTPDAGLAVVAHSLGGPSALLALDGIDGAWQLGSFVAVSGFTGTLPALPVLDDFLAVAPDVERTAARVLHATVVASDDDPLIPEAQSIDLATRLGARRVVVPGGGHFLGAQGHTTLPAALEAVQPDS